MDKYATQLIKNRRSVEEFIAEHGNSASGSSNLLWVAYQIHTADHPTLSPRAKDAGLRQVIMSSLAQRNSSYQPRIQRTPTLSRRLQPTILAVALVVALLGGTVGTAYAAEESLPGDMLYPVKTTREQIAIAIAPAEDNTTMRLWIAERRTSELEQLGAAGRGIPASVLDAVQNATMTAAGTIAASESPQVQDVQRLADITTRQNAAILQAAGLVPAGAWANLERARITSEHALTIANRILRSPQSNGGYPVVPPGQERKIEDPEWDIPPGLEEKDGTPPGQQQRNEIPPGQEKKDELPPGQKQVPPGQEKKDEDPVSEVPPGLEDKGGEPPGQEDKDHSPPGQDKKD